MSSPMTKITLTTALSSLMLLSGSAVATESFGVNSSIGDGGRDGARYNDWATVTNVEAVERTYTIRKPVEKCWTETVRIQERAPSDGSMTNELIGGLLGGAIGNQFGKGRGKDAMTIAGAALGASIAHDQERLQPAQPRAGGRYQEVERCETVYETEEKKEHSHYRVTYRYGGQEFSANMRSAPGEQIRVRVQVTPR